MPWFTLHRNYTLSSTKGHIVNFKKDARTWVPAALVQEALSIGAKPEEDIEKLLPQEKQEAQIVPDAKRKEAMFAAFEKIVLRNARGDFLASGQPHPRKLLELTGFETSEKERQVMWEQYNQMKSDEATQ